MPDPRFSKFASDPRYRLPNRKEARTSVDSRFGGLFTDKDFRRKAKVDRYGRKIRADSNRKELERLYRLSGDQTAVSKKHSSAKDAEQQFSDSEEEDEVELKSRKRDPAREGGFSESSSDEESSSDAESEAAAEEALAELTAGQEQTEEVPLGEVSRRIAAVNLDWDNIRAVDIMVVASSFVPQGGKIKSVTIYPSEFGRERLEREAIQGPPKEIFADSNRKDDANANYNDEFGDEDELGSDDESDDDKEIEHKLQQDQVNEGKDFDMTRLREYQLERLRYYYAVIECDTLSTSKALYDNMDGREYLATANFFDLRFIPEDMSLEEDEPHEECNSIPEGYRPNEFKTQALTHSKVRLTWDDDDTTRKEVQKRAFSRAEIDENDLKAYIGSNSSDSDSATSRKSAAETRKVRKKEAERAKMRAALGLSDEPAKGSTRKDAPLGDMQITFTSGLSNKGKAGDRVLENEPQDEESTRDRYVRKERERKKKRKDKMKAARVGSTTADIVEGNDGGAAAASAGDGADEDKGFDDPFFDDPAASAAAAKKARKADRARKLAAKAELDEEEKARRAELELLMVDDRTDQMRHFDMREIEKAEKTAKRKTKKRARNGTADSNGVGADAFEIEPQDPRFKALYENHEFAIDPTNPRYKSTTAMQTLLEEGRKKRRIEDR